MADISSLNDEEYFLAYSGGKDSDVLRHVANKTKLKFRVIHNFTTLGAKKQIKYVLKQRPNVEIIYPKKTFYQLIEEKGLPIFFKKALCFSLGMN